MKACRTYVCMLTALLVMVSAISCRHKDIECPRGMQGIHVMFEWDRSANADVAGMTIYFYPIGDRGGMWRFDIAGRDGGQVEFPAGRYCMIACNNDLPGVKLEDNGSPSMTRATAVRLSAPDVYGSTGMLYDAVVRDLEVTPCGVRYVTEAGAVKECGKGLIRCHPDSLATQYTVALRKVKGLERVRSANVILKGVRDAIYLEDGRPSEVCAALSMRMDLDRVDAVMSALGCGFAPREAADTHYSLSLRVILNNGQGVARDIPLTPENLNSITAHNVIITIEGIEIPDEGSPGGIGGIDVGVDGWDEIDIEIEPSI